MKMQKWLVLPIAAALLAGAPTAALADQEDGIEKIDDVIEVFTEMMADSDTRIPPGLIESSDAIAIIPDLAQGGFIVGARRGKGLMLVRQPDGTWSNPAFLTLTGGSLGLQIGGQSSDVILLFRDPDAVADVVDGDFEFGVNASGTAGPVGATALDASEFDGDILSYSRSAGLFGGVALEGGEIGFDENRNEDFYEVRNIPADKILTDADLPIPGEIAPSLFSLFETLDLPPASTSLIAGVTDTGTTPTTSSTSTRQAAAIETVDLERNINLRRAKNLARQMAERVNGGLGQYHAESTMHGPVESSPYVTNSDGSWTFTFLGGQPGWEANGIPATVESVVTVTPEGLLTLDANDRLR